MIKLLPINNVRICKSLSGAGGKGSGPINNIDKLYVLGRWTFTNSSAVSGGSAARVSCEGHGAGWEGTLIKRLRYGMIGAAEFRGPEVMRAQEEAIRYQNNPLATQIWIRFIYLPVVHNSHGIGDVNTALICTFQVLISVDRKGFDGWVTSSVFRSSDGIYSWDRLWKRVNAFDLLDSRC